MILAASLVFVYASLTRSPPCVRDTVPRSRQACLFPLSVRQPRPIKWSTIPWHEGSSVPPPPRPSRAPATIRRRTITGSRSAFASTMPDAREHDVRCIVVRDELFQKDVIVEATNDWYAQA